MPNIPVISFNSGEGSPQIDARSDVAKYASMCRVLENFIPRIYGSAERRPGTQFIGSHKNASEKSRVVSFRYSDTIAYILEYGPEHIRFFFDGGRVIGSASPDDWEHYGTYKLGEFVTYSRTIYRNIVKSGWEDKIVSNWKLNENASNKTVIDSFGSINGVATANTSTLSAAGTPGITEGRVFDFDGQYAVEIADNAKHSFGNGTVDSAFTVAAWIYVTNVAVGQIILSKKDTDGREWQLFLGADETLVFDLMDESANANVRKTSDDALSTGWHFVCATYSGIGGTSAADGINLYVDKELVDSTSGGTGTYVAMENLTEKVVIGARHPTTGLGTFFQDKIDNVAIFNKELSSDEVAAIYTTPADNFTDWVETDLTDDNEPIAETPTPYQEADLFELQVRQSADVMWIVHPDYAQRKLTRTTPITFDLSIINFVNGPFLPRNDLENADGITITPSATTGNITLTASAAVFDSAHISAPGALFKITHARATTETSGSSAHPTTGVIGSAIDVKETFSFNTHGTWAKTVKLERNENEEGWETYRTFISDSDRNIQFTGTEEADNVQYRINVTSSTSGTLNADLTVNNSTESGICRIDTFISSTQVTATVLTDFASTDASKRWFEGAWSAFRGYPTAFTFFGGRAVYAGTKKQPQTVWLSETDDFENFEEGINDSDSFSLTMSSDKMNAIRWLSALDALLLGTIGGEWRIRATAIDEALTPTNFDERQQTSYGSKKIQPIPVGDAILFVDYVGRKVRELTFLDEKQKYVAPDLSALAEHITLSGITSLDYQRNPDAIVWSTLDNGNLLSMSYERDQDVIAWSGHPLGGTSAKAESVAVIPGTTEDEIWLSTSRTVDGSTTRQIERMAPRVDVDLEDAFFVDSGLVFDGGDPIVITNVTQADPGVVSLDNTNSDGSQRLQDGDQIYIAGIVGMTELNGNFYTVANTTKTSLTLRTFVETSSSPSASASS